MKSIALMLMSVGLFATLGETSEAKGQEFGYAAITIKNPTSNMLVYRIKWGADSEWQNKSLPAGHSLTHYFPLDCDARAPIPFIEFDWIGGNGEYDAKSYRLDFYARSYRGPHGKVYTFRYSGCGRYLDLNS